MRPRKNLPTEITDKLKNVGVSLILRELKEVLDDNAMKAIREMSYEAFIDKINRRLHSCLPTVGMAKVENFQDLMELEIRWYNIGGAKIYDYDGLDLSLHTKKGKIYYCISYFLDDIYRSCGVYGSMNNKVRKIMEKVTNQLLE